jgi:acyl-CoA synthetase (AMP-forming)/AMP-acid ligase II
VSYYENLAAFAGNIAAIGDDGQSITYGELLEFSAEISRAARGRCLVFSLCQNSMGALAGYVSFINNRIVPLLLAAELDRQLLDNLLAAYKPEYLWVPVAKRAELSGWKVVFEKRGYALLETKYQDKFALNDDLALLLTTSGSTGSPKLVRQTYKNIQANAQAIAQYLAISRDERPITTLPMNYTYGLSIINSHLLAGATILLTSKTFIEKGFWRFFKEQKATSFGGVPYTYEMLKKLRLFNMDLPSLKTMTQAGGKLTPELTGEFAEFAAKNLSPNYALSKCGSIGLPIPGGEFYLIDDNGNIINTPGTVGELVYKGPNVTMGYAECGADLAKGDEWGGVLVTGDMAKRDGDGFYYITGRKKRFIKLYGNRINLDEAERLIKTVVPDCACAGCDDHMIIHVTEQGKEKEVKEFISGKTGINPLAFEVLFVADIPKNEAGKTIYTKLGA